MNYIKHLAGFFDKVSEDDRLNPTHVSLYVSLFQFWNACRFSNPISISRQEAMRVSKIASKATYHKCIRELNDYGYLSYHPSYNPFKGSLVYLFNFQASTEQVLNKQRTSAKQVLNKQQTSTEQALVPYINNTNIINSINNTKRERKNSRAKSTNNLKSIKNEKSKNQSSDPASAKIQVQKNTEAAAEVPSGSLGIAQHNPIKPSPSDLQEKASCDPEEAPHAKDRTNRGENIERIQDLSRETSNEKQGIPPQPPTPGFIRPLLQQVKDHFAQKGWPPIEAEKYFNHYQSNGWLVGGKTPMADWHASAEKWILNQDHFKNQNRSVTRGRHPEPVEGRTPKPGHLNTNQDKNYAEPL